MQEPPPPSSGAGDARRAGRVIDAIAYASIAFLRSSDPEGEMAQVLQRLGEATGVSRAYVYENIKMDGALADVERFEWNFSGITPSTDASRKTGSPYMPDYERYVRVLAVGGTIAELASAAPDSERATLEQDGVLAIALVPIFVGDAWWGYIGFEDCETEREWSTLELSALRTVAETLGAALERTDLDSSMKALEARYRTLVEQARDMFVYADVPEENDATIYVSPQVEQILGVTPKRWLDAESDTLWVAMLHPDDRERVQTEYARFLEGGPDPHDYRMVREDGRVVWIRDRATLIRDPDGRMLEWGVMMDITEQKNIEAKLREAKEEYRALVERLPIVTYTEAIDGPNTLLYCSPQIEPLLGYSPEEWMHDPDLWNATCHPDDLERVNLEDEASKSTGHFASEYRMIARDGHVVWVQDEEHLIRDADGTPMYWLGVLMDISERREADASV